MDIEITRIFVKVVQYGSFSKAALALNQPKSTVSKAIAKLEFETKTKLLVRTTRSLTLTAAGRVFFDASSGAIQILEEAQKALSGSDSILSGLVRITAPEDLGANVIAPAVAELAAKHPSLNFELRYTDDIVDLVRDGFDIAIRIGRVGESSFKVKRIGEVVLVPVASPVYLKKGMPIVAPDDLSSRDCIALTNISYSAKWTLRKSNETKTVSVKPRITSNQMSSLLRSALAGGGVAFVPKFLCQDLISRGQLERVLPEWESPGLLVSMVSPQASSSSARLKVTSDHIFAAVQKALT